MSKYLKLKFTGNAVLTPDYPDDLSPRPGPLQAVMPGARQRRPSVFRGQQIDAQFAFIIFPIAQLVVREKDDRDADYRYPDVTDPQTGVCFLEREQITVEERTPQKSELTFVEGDPRTSPDLSSRETRRIARWADFSLGQGRLRSATLTDPGDCVRVVIPRGEVSAGYVAEPIALVDFDYDGPASGPGTSSPSPRPGYPYAQEIVVSMEFDDSATEVRLRCNPFFTNANANPDVATSYLRFIWGGRRTIELLFGNGSFASLQSVLDRSVAGHDHFGDYDVEFHVMHDVINCPPDYQGRQPLPHITSREILRVPCLASMIGTSDASTPSGTAWSSAAVPEIASDAESATATAADVAPPKGARPDTPGKQPEFQQRALPTQRRERRKP